MIYEQVKHLKPEDFKRLCGVRPETFDGSPKQERIGLQEERHCSDG